jgi:drug/metabolite transporter (DMT)-like permease
VVHFSAVSLAICLVALAISGEAGSALVVPNAATAAMLLGVGLTATIGQIFLTKAFAAGPPAKVSVVGLAQVVFGMMYDVAVWQREFDAMTLAGIVLVLAPTAWLLLRGATATAADPTVALELAGTALASRRDES